MIDHAHYAAAMPLHEIDRTLQLQPIADLDGILAAARIAPNRIFQAEAQLVERGSPVGFAAARCCSQPRRSARSDCTSERQICGIAGASFASSR